MEGIPPVYESAARLCELHECMLWIGHARIRVLVRFFSEAMPAEGQEPWCTSVH